MPGPQHKQTQRTDRIRPFSGNHPLVELVETLVELVETPVDLVETPVDLVETPVELVETYRTPRQARGA
ncbi:hypothetical protein [Microlunatus sp. Y2014]|uniref:hypothetical protein n=1 Tax=Microlunatus sp. Y2014 TaxID=3418488 RepID=UPI003DA79F49